nr:uncharacterized protein LOC120965253 isoform X2 [Aegilops tauschii subsp. strangulata]
MEDGSQICNANGTTTIVGDQRGSSTSSFSCDGWNNACSTTCAPQCSGFENTNGVFVGHHSAGPSLTFEPVMTSTTLLQSMGNDYHPSLLLDGFPTFCPALPLISLPPPPENGPGCNDANQPSQMLAADEKAAANHHQQDPSTVSKKREERDRAKQRYYEKKKNRKSCTHPEKRVRTRENELRADSPRLPMNTNTYYTQMQHKFTIE